MAWFMNWRTGYDPERIAAYEREIRHCHGLIEERDTEVAALKELVTDKNQKIGDWSRRLREQVEDLKRGQELSNLRAEEIRTLQAEVESLRSELAVREEMVRAARRANDDAKIFQQKLHQTIDTLHEERRKQNGHLANAHEEAKRLAEAANVLDRDMKLCQKHLREARKASDDIGATSVVRLNRVLELTDESAELKRQIEVLKNERDHECNRSGQLKCKLQFVCTSLADLRKIGEEVQDGLTALIGLADPGVTEPSADLPVHGKESVLGTPERTQND